MIESDVVKEWQAEAAAKARGEQAGLSVIAVLEARFGEIGPETEAKSRGCGDLEKLQAWVPQAANAPALDSFRAAAGI